MKIFFTSFLTHFKRSLSDWSFYKEIGAGQHKVKVSYALILSIINSLVVSILFVVSFYTFIIPQAHIFVNERFPQDVVITLKSGELTINKPVPYYFELRDKEKIEGKKNIIAIDTDAPAEIGSPQKYETVVFLNKDTMISQVEGEKIEIYPLKDFPDMTISQESINNFLEKIKGFGWLISIVVFAFITLLNFIGILIISLISGFFLWIILKIASRTTVYKDAFNISMHAYTFIFVIDLLLLFVHGTFGFPLAIFFTVALGCLFSFIKNS